MPSFVGISRKGSRGGSPQPPKKKKPLRSLADLSLVVNKPEEHLPTQSKPAKREITPQGIYQPICMICNAKPVGYYGRWGDSGTCSLACETKQNLRRARLK